MPSKQLKIDDTLSVTVHKRRSSRNLRLTVKPDGTAHISIPIWATYRSAIAFAESRKDWILAHIQPLGQLRNGQLIGKTHELVFVARPVGFKVASRVIGSKIIINHPSDLAINEPAVQVIAEAAAEKALRKQAAALLPDRVDKLASQHGFSYQDVRIKRLKSRWGSCDNQQRIVLNLFLMQLEDHLIDYVLLHELTHTQHLNHGPEFWQRLAEVCPNYKWLRKAVHSHKPIIDRA